MDGADRVRVLVDDLVSVGAYHIIRRIPVYDCVDIDLLEIDTLVVLQVEKNFLVQISAFLRWLPILQDLTVQVLVERARCDKRFVRCALLSHLTQAQVRCGNFLLQFVILLDVFFEGFDDLLNAFSPL